MPAHDNSRNHAPESRVRIKSIKLSHQERLQSWLAFKPLRGLLTGGRPLPIEQVPNDYKHLAPLKFSSLIFSIENIFADREGFVLAAGALVVWLLTQTPNLPLQTLVPIWIPNDLLAAHPGWTDIITRLTDQIFYHRLAASLVLYGPIFEVAHKDKGTYLTPTIVAQAVRMEHMPDPTSAITTIWAKREAEICKVAALLGRSVSATS